MKVNLTIEIPGGKTISGNCRDLSQLSAKFQIWARRFGVTDCQSLAYLCAGGDIKWRDYYDNEIEMLRFAVQCERAIALHKLPVDFAGAVPS